MRPVSSSIKAMRRVSHVAIYSIVTLGALLQLIPFAWMASTALKDAGAVFLFPPQWIPNPVAWENFSAIFDIMPFGLFLKNTVIVTGVSLMGGLLTASLAAYGFARLDFVGRDFLFMLVISSMLLPGQVTMIPVFLIFKFLGWVDTFKPLIVPSFLGGGAFYIFLLRQFFLTIPTDFDDAARIDGCNDLTIYWRVILPLSKPALISVAVFSFMGHWNDFFMPLIYLNSMEKYTLAVGLNLFRGQFYTHFHWLMAASLIAVLPCIITFFVAQKYFIQGVVMSGLKG